jgi:zinc protease
MRTLAAVAVSLASFAAAADRSRPPEPGPPRTVTLPDVQRRTLPNGLTVLIVEQHEVPTVQVSLWVRAGAAADPKERPGVAAMTADLLDEGAGNRGALELADALDGLGAQLTTGAGWDASSAGLHVPVKRLPEALPLLADIVLRPRFDPAELERARKEALTAILQQRDDPEELAAAALAHAIFGDHRYGTPSTGDAQSLSQMTGDDVRRFHAQHYRPGNATLIVVGDVTSAVLDLVERAFGAWPAGGTMPAAVAPPRAGGDRPLWLIDRPGAAQSVVRIGQVAPVRRAPRYHALEVANTLLGGLFTSRLNDNLREKNGYAYGAASGIDYRRVAGRFRAAANVQTPSTAPALSEMLKELGRIVTPAQEDEVARTRSYLAMSYPQQFETPGQIAAQLADQVVYELPPDEFTSYVPKVMAVTVEGAARAAASVLKPGQMAVVIVGDRARIEAPLRGLKLGTWRIVTTDEVLGPPPRLD